MRIGLQFVIVNCRGPLPDCPIEHWSSDAFHTHHQALKEAWHGVVEQPVDRCDPGYFGAAFLQLHMLMKRAIGHQAEGQPCVARNTKHSLVIPYL